MELAVMENSVREQLIRFNNDISQLDLLNPSPEVTHLFNELLKFCCSTPLSSFVFERMLETDSVVEATCDNLRLLRSRYEYNLEMNYAKIYAHTGNQNLIQNYFDDGNYHQLVRLEMDMLRELGIFFSQNSRPNGKDNPLVTKIAFVGSGPIPASSILILREYAPSVDIYNIDISYEANQLASIICGRLLPSNLFKAIHFITQNISEEPIPMEVESILKDCQLIFLAALVGHNELSKLDILRNLTKHSKNDADRKAVQHIVIRTTDGLRQVLYPKLSVESIKTLPMSTICDGHNNENMALLEIQAINHPQNDVAISIIIAKIM